MGLAQLCSDLLQSGVRFEKSGILSHTQHMTGCVVVWHESTLPVCQVLPGRSCKEAIIRDFQYVGIAQAASAHAGPTQDHNAIEDAYLLNAKTADGRCPEELADVPVAAGEIPVPVALAPFQDQYAVTLLGEAHGGDTAAKARPDDYVVKGFLRSFSHGPVPGLPLM